MPATHHRLDLHHDVGRRQRADFTGARIDDAFGPDHRWSSPLGRWKMRTGTPAVALVVQCLITLMPVVAFGLAGEPDENMMNTPFTRMANFTMPVFWFFLLSIGVAFFLLRSGCTTGRRAGQRRGFACGTRRSMSRHAKLTPCSTGSIFRPAGCVHADSAPPAGRGIPPRCVAPRSNTASILARRAWRSGRRAPAIGTDSARTDH